MKIISENKHRYVIEDKEQYYVVRKSSLATFREHIKTVKSRKGKKVWCQTELPIG